MNVSKKNQWIELTAGKTLPLKENTPMHFYLFVLKKDALGSEIYSNLLGFFQSESISVLCDSVRVFVVSAQQQPFMTARWSMQEHAAHSSQLTDLPESKKLVLFLLCNMWKFFFSIFASYVNVMRKFSQHYERSVNWRIRCPSVAADGLNCYWKDWHAEYEPVCQIKSLDSQPNIFQFWLLSCEDFLLLHVS